MGRLATLKSDVNIKQILLYYGWDGVARGVGAWKKMLCPFHKDTNPSGSVNLEKNRYHCFTCGIGGDIIDVVMEAEHFSTVRETADWIEVRF